MSKENTSEITIETFTTPVYEIIETKVNGFNYVNPPDVKICNNPLWECIIKVEL